MRLRDFAFVVLSCGTTLALTPVCAATTVISNLSQATVGSGAGVYYYAANPSIQVDSGMEQAAPFIAGSAALLTDVTLSTGRQDSPTQILPFTVQLRADSAGQPGNVLINLTGSTNPPSGLNTYTAPISFPLVSGTRYWLAASVPYDGPQSGLDSVFYRWNETNSSASTGDPGWTIGQKMSRMTYVSSGSTAPWEVPSGDTTRLLFSVQVAAVPEPSCGPLLIFGIVSCAGHVRRRRAASYTGRNQ